MKIEKTEVLRYLGHQHGEVEKKMSDLIEESIKETTESVQGMFTYKVFDLHKEGEKIYLKDSILIFRGKDIQEHLKNADRCAVMAVTLGIAIERKIQYYERKDLTRSVILDACATAMVEGLCDECEKEIEGIASKEGRGITYRYSPGYGDFSLEIQKDIIQTLEADRRIGLTVTESSILLPRKSVTAVIGFQSAEIKKQHPGCRNCNKREECLYRRGGQHCGD